MAETLKRRLSDPVIWIFLVTMIFGAGGVYSQIRAFADDQARQDRKIHQTRGLATKNDKELSVLKTEVRTRLDSIDRALTAQTRTLERLDHKIDRMNRPPADYR